MPTDYLWPIAGIAIVVLVLATLLFLASRYRRCPSDQILVIFGSMLGNQTSRVFMAAALMSGLCFRTTAT